jgi:Leucine-rich repeat (LRR) protein
VAKSNTALVAKIVSDILLGIFGVGENEIDLDLSYRGLTNDDVHRITQALQSKPEIAAKIRTLNLCRCNLEELPNLSNFSGLKHLNINDNYTLKTAPKLPPSIETVDLGSTKIEELQLGELPNLVKLECVGAALNAAPDFSGCPKLERLDLMHNKLTEPPIVAGLTKLKYLGLRSNQLIACPNLDGLTDLEHLDLTTNDITEFPAIEHLKRLEYFSIQYNKVSKVPPIDLSRILTFAIGYNPITVIPSLYALINLENLQIGGTQITALPDFTHFKKLKILVLSEMNLESMPNFTGLVALTNIEINGNQIREVPEDFFDAHPDLQRVNLSANRITRMPDLIDATKLQYLDLQNNQLTRPPNFVNFLNSQVDGNSVYTKIVLSRNPFSSIGILEILQLTRRHFRHEEGIIFPQSVLKIDCIHFNSKMLDESFFSDAVIREYYDQIEALTKIEGFDAPLDVIMLISKYITPFAEKKMQQQLDELLCFCDAIRDPSARAHTKEEVKKYKVRVPKKINDISDLLSLIIIKGFSFKDLNKPNASGKTLLQFLRDLKPEDPGYKSKGRLILYVRDETGAPGAGVIKDAQPLQRLKRLFRM